MKALVYTRAYTFELQEVANPSPGPDDLLVRVKACGICGSDIHGATGQTGRRQPPIVMGHEAAGIVEQTGENVTGYKPGDRITFDSTIYCGCCDYCKRDRVNLCDNRMVLGVSCDDYRRQGAMAEYVVIPHHIAYPVPDELTFAEAGMIEPVSVAMHAVNRTSFDAGAHCAVVGTGLIGLLTVQMLKQRNCGPLVGFDIDDDRLTLARRFGADKTVNLETQPQEKRAYLDQFDCVIEAVGIEATVNVSVDLVKKGGAVTVVGNLAPTITFPVQKIVTKEISFNGSCASAGEYPECIAAIASGKIAVNPLISRRVPLSEGVRYFDILIHNKEKLFKVILEP